MEQQSVEAQLRLFFSKATRHDWKRIAIKETGGRDPFEALSWRNSDDIAFAPYYDAEDIQQLQHARAWGTPAAHAVATSGWLNISSVSISDPKQVHAAALEHIQNGANGLWLDLREDSAFDIEALIAAISQSGASLFLVAGENAEFHALWNIFKDHPNLRCALFRESITEASTVMPPLNDGLSFHAHGLLIKPSSPVQEIAQALIQGVHAYELAQDISHPDALGSICFSMPADLSFLVTIAKLRALRRLWYQVARAYGHADYMPGDLHLHARSEPFSDMRYTPRENMLKATFTGMAAVLGGCDSLTLLGPTDDSLFHRWSRNASNILLEESFLGKKRDALAGSYAVEAMTDAFAAEGWKLFQSKQTERQ